MHEHDLDLVAGLADGSLDRDPDGVRRWIETCDVCATEYRLQTEARSALTSLGPALLTDAERVALHARLEAALPQPAPVPAVARARSSAPAWWRLLPVAGAAVLALAVGGFLAGRSGDDAGGDATAAETVSSDRDQALPPDATTTTVVEQAGLLDFAGEEAPAAEPTPAEGGGEARSDEQETGSPDATVPPTTVAATEETGTTDAPAPPSIYRVGPSASLAELVAALTDPNREPGDFTPDVEFQCVEATSSEPVDGIMGEVDGVMIEVFRLSAGDGEQVLEGFVATDCSRVELPG